jgi:hypothetical protein
MHARISADWQNLLEQASSTADKYFHEAIRSIDGYFGEGYAQKHPALIGTFMEVACADFKHSGVLVCCQEFMEVFNEAFCQLSSSLDRIAKNLDQ